MIEAVTPMTVPARPTNIRHRIIGVTMLMAFILYLDRICMGEIVKSVSFHQDLGLSKEQIGKILGSFFFAYALFQVPAGWASDRFGARPMLTIYIVLWSLFTAMTGFVSGFTGLLMARLLCGVAEAGAYPTAMALIRKWVPLIGRARASGSVALGGRIGGTLAPFLTIWMIVTMGSWRTSLWIDAVAGLLIAAIFWNVVRSNPQKHPKVNAAELALIGRPRVEPPLSGANDDVVTIRTDDFLRVPAAVEARRAEGGIAPFEVARTAPRVELAFHAQLGPDAAARRLWSSWGDICVADDGRVYCAIGDHSNDAGGDARCFLYCWKPKEQRLRQIVDMSRVVPPLAGQPAWSKVHAKIDQGADGEIHFSCTLNAGGKAGDPKYGFNDTLPGGQLYRYDPASGRTEVVASLPARMKPNGFGLTAFAAIHIPASER